MTIPIEALRAVTDVYVHAPCADGLACALLLQDALPKARIHHIVLGSQEHRAIVPRPGLLFADMVPTAGDLKGLVNVAEFHMRFADAGTIVLDHHKGNRAIVEAMGARGIFADEATQPGISGAPLVYEHVWKTMADADGLHDAGYMGPRCAAFAQLAGIRDTWQKTHRLWERACEQQAFLAKMPRSYLMKLGIEGILETSLDMSGEYFRAEHMEKVEEAARNAFDYTTQRGTRVKIITSTELTSDVAEWFEERQEWHGVKGAAPSVAGHPSSLVDLIVGFHYKLEAGDPRLILSTRSHTNFDCLAFCKVLGGGGHTRAAGAWIPQSVLWRKQPNPFKLISGLIDNYESELL